MYIPKPIRLANGDYFIRLRLGGENVPVTASTAKKCIDEARAIKASHKLQNRRRKTDKTLRQAIESYVKTRSNSLSPPTVRGYNAIKRNRFQSIMDKPIKDIKDWQEEFNKEANTVVKGGQKISEKYLMNSWGLVASVLRDNRIEIPDNMTFPQVPKYDSKYLEPEQIPIFLKAIKGHRCEIVALLGLHSLRRSEMFSENMEINIKKKRIKVFGAAVYDNDNKLVQKVTNKNETSTRYIPILIDRLSILVKQNGDKPLIEYAPNTLYRDIRYICKNNNLPVFGYHGLRHSFASLAHHLGMPEMIAAQMGGWKDLNTMKKIYTHLSQKDVEKYGNEMREFFNGKEAEKTEVASSPALNVINY